MRSVFIDASYLVALEVANDQNHPRAAEHWARVESAGVPELVTTSFVFNEVVTYLNSRNLHAKAIEVGEDLLGSDKVRLVRVDDELFGEGWEYFVRHHDNRYSLTDCVSFIVMRRFGIQTTYSFDHHFRQAGFDIEP